MTVFMLPGSTAPQEYDLSEADRRTLLAHFETTNYEMVVDGEGIDWEKIDEVEVVVASRDKGLSGWFIRNIYFGGQERYHVGVYSGRNELVLPNLTLNAAKYVVRTIAYYLRKRVIYQGPSDFVATIEA